MRARRLFAVVAAAACAFLAIGGASPASAEDWPVVCEYWLGADEWTVECNGTVGFAVSNSAAPGVVTKALELLDPNTTPLPPLPTVPADCEDAAVNDGDATCTVDGTYITVD